MSKFSDQIPTFRKIGRFFTWRRIRRFLLVGAAIVTLFAVYFTEEDWRGRRMWNAYIKELAAQGVPVTMADLDKFKPAPVPDDQNFFGAPFFKQFAADSYVYMPDKLSRLFSWSNIAGKNPKWGVLEQNPDYDYPFMNDGQPGMAYDGTGHVEDISVWKKGLDQSDLVEAFKKFDPALNEIADAARRPFVRLPGPPLGYYGLTWGGSFWFESWDLSGVYELRGLAELDAGQTDRAADDVVTLLGSCDAVTGVRTFHPTSGLQVLWEGLVTHQWTDGQLVAMQAALQKVDYFSLLAQSYQRSIPYVINRVEGFIADPSVLIGRIRPFAGKDRWPYWWYWLKVELYPKSRMYQGYLEDLQDHEAMLSAFDVANRKLDGMKIATQRLQLKKSHPGVNAPVAKATIASTIADEQELGYIFFDKNVNRLRILDLAVVACGLERYRLANGQFPEKLEAIAPQFLAKIPNDIIGGDPLHYRRLEDDRYLLYAIGNDGIDHGGKPGLDLEHTDAFVTEKSDLVWPSLPKAKTN